MPGIPKSSFKMSKGIPPRVACKAAPRIFSPPKKDAWDEYVEAFKVEDVSPTIWYRPNLDDRKAIKSKPVKPNPGQLVLINKLPKKEPKSGIDIPYYNEEDLVPPITAYGYKIPKRKKKKDERR